MPLKDLLGCPCTPPAFDSTSPDGTVRTTSDPGQDETVRTAADLERQFAMLAYIRDRLRDSAGEDFRVP